MEKKDQNPRMDSSLGERINIRRYFDDVETSYNTDKTQGGDTDNDIQQKEGFSSIYLCPLDHNGTNSYIKEWKAKADSAPSLVLLHDLGRSMNPYKKLAKALNEVGFHVFCVDLRAHGYTTSSTGISSFTQLVNDLLQIVAWSRYKTDSRHPPIILADGFSALISIYFAKLHPSYCSSLILSNPVMEFPIRTSRTIKVIIKLLSKCSSSLLCSKVFFLKKISLKLANYIKSGLGNDSEIEYAGIDQVCSSLSLKFIDDLIEATYGSFEAFQGIREDTLILNPKNERMSEISLFMLEEHLDKTKIRTKEFDSNYLLSSEQYMQDIVESIKDWTDKLYKK